MRVEVKMGALGYDMETGKIATWLKQVGDAVERGEPIVEVETDNVWFTCLTMNTNQTHFNAPLAARSRFGRPLVNSPFTLALVPGLTVPDTSENAAATLEWVSITLPRPVFAGDTLWAESEILAKRDSRSDPEVGIVAMRSRGINQRREVVIQFKRTFMVHRRGAPAAADRFPGTDETWSV